MTHVVRDRSDDLIHPKLLPSAPLYAVIRESALTYGQIERRCGMKRGSLSSLVASQRARVTWDLADRICTALGIPAPLLYFKEW